MFAFTSKQRRPVQQAVGKRYFTVDQARRSLTLIRKIVADIQDVQKLRLECHAQINDVILRSAPRNRTLLQKQFDAGTQRLENLMEELEQVGVQLRDPSRGMLDFPALHEGREVLLCWKADEPTISYWHEVGSGYAGRKPVSAICAG